MEWQATDQFGNLYVGESDAKSAEELRPHLAMLVSELRERVGERFRVTVDFGYNEIIGPDPEQVSHVLRVPWLATAPQEETLADLEQAVVDICQEQGLSQVTFGSA